MDHVSHSPIALAPVEMQTEKSSKRAHLDKPLSSARRPARPENDQLDTADHPQQQQQQQQQQEQEQEQEQGQSARADDAVDEQQAPDETHGVVSTERALEVAISEKEDPRMRNGKKALVKAKGKGRNTESFDPASTLVRPDMRILVGSKSGLGTRLLRHDDVMVVPDFFCEEGNWAIYNDLVREMRAAQAQGLAQSEWISWHEGAHLISKNPSGSPTFQRVVQAMREYYHIKNENAGTRFNWYKDVDDWKPFHHDSAAFNPQRAKQQNITVGVSFGANRELAFLSTKTNAKIYFPQANGALFSFGRDVNITWKHGVNALTAEEKRREQEFGESRCAPDVPVGRISIVLWGQCDHVLEEAGSPPMLSDGKGHHMHHPSQPVPRRPRSCSRDRDRVRGQELPPPPRRDSRDRGDRRDPRDYRDPPRDYRDLPRVNRDPRDGQHDHRDGRPREAWGAAAPRGDSRDVRDRKRERSWGREDDYRRDQQQRR